MTRQRLGQHFLHDAGWREQIARVIRVSRHEPERHEARPHCWIEIGAGHGEMTEYLAATGAPVYAVELDSPLIGGLQKLARRFPNLAVVAGDVLQTDLAAIASGRRVKLYGNLPYYITSPILHRFFENAELIDEIHIVIQLEVALRLAAKPRTRDYGYLSVLTQYYSHPSIELEIPRSAFHPPPEVGSALVSMKLPGENAKLRLNDGDKFLDFVKACFAQKRKTLVNNLRGAAEPVHIKEALAEMDLAATARAEELSVSALADLYRRLGQGK
ncbi:MAG TPA: 16S rRNA (adenine(1518)-N(6)/adenine(1519)-N(6))-dimethyltransferase RsmA [Candidatus Acidoferrum sp.]|nr:16S rRNA (adenine(1518)-N(6)/adenine(1519)-N(6))-dimethyltransferase RsmA [Candidatus Acidoferrum sp.]